MINFKMWLEGQITFGSYQDFKKRVNIWVEKFIGLFRTPPLRTVDLGTVRTDANDLLATLDSKTHPPDYVFITVLHRILYNLGELQDSGMLASHEEINDELSKIRAEGAKIYSEFEAILARKQTDNFALVSDSGNYYLPSSHDRVTLGHDAQRKQRLIRLYRWANNSVGNDPNGRHLLKNLDRNIFDKMTWIAVLDLAEELGVKVVEGPRRAINDIFETEPTDKMTGVGGYQVMTPVKGWHDSPGPK